MTKALVKFAVVFTCLVTVSVCQRTLTGEKVREALMEAEREIEQQFRKENQNSKRRVSPAILAHGAFAPPTPVAVTVQRQAKTLAKASKRLGVRSRNQLEFGADLGIDGPTLAGGVSKDDITEELASSFQRGNRGFYPEQPQLKCLKTAITCNPGSRFREIDGRCNNRFNPEFGSASVTYLRHAESAYEDFDNPRKMSSDKKTELPSPRKVSMTVHETKPTRNGKISHMVMQWGQFLDHDITLTPQARGLGGQVMDCTECNSGESVSDECFPIPVPSDDGLFRNGTCLHFLRSQAGQLSLGTREQVNQITSYIDASNVYGSDSQTAAELRQHEEGLLNISGNGLLPTKHEPACAMGGGNKCFKAGDIRCNVQAGLMSMHTLWVKHHNSLARRLKEINPHWDDERLYQEARRIVGAQHQHITYNEYLPIVLGPEFMEKYGLKPNKRSHYHGYDRRCDATIYNEFATAAYRFGHSLVDDTMRASHGKDNFQLRGHFMDPTMLHDDEKFSSALLEGLTKQKAQKMDRFVSNSLRNHLFGSGEAADGLDLIALNIQRGRDHGLSPYYRYRRIFGLPTPSTFKDLEKIMGADTTEALKNTYRNVEDIDLYSGILCEPHVEGALMGELGAHLVAAQFHRLKDCDRFFYENGREAGSFTRKQLKEIRKSTTLAKILCQHVSEKSELSADAFKINLSGPSLKCEPGDASRQMDLSSWKDRNKSSIKIRGKRSVRRRRPPIIEDC